MGKPTIRFEGYTDDWEQRKLSEISDVRDGTHDSPSYLSDGHPFVTSKNVKDGYINYDDVQYISDEDFEAINKRSKVDMNDILMGMIGTIGNLALIRTEPDFAIKNVALIKDTKQVSYMYLYHYLQSSSAERQLLSGLDGGTQKFVSLKNIRELNIMVPSEAEQLKVGNFIESLDHLITLHHRKCEETKKLKKFMLQKMFPKKGEKVPDIRFDGFTDDWEQRKVSEIAIEKLSNGIMNNQSDDETGVKHINVINMYDTDKIHPEKLTFSNYDEEAVKKCNVEFGDIFLTRSSLKPEGIAEANVLLDSGRFVYDDHLIRLKVNKEKYDPFFVKLNLSGNAFKRQFIVRAKTTAFTTIGQEDISECLGFFPKKEEQQQIGEYFMTLDHLITLHQHKCEELQNIKKFMLQNMFT
ncbi:restriction endonuclease subunit S [Dorea longicatena]|uniref:restriction endonuclease subunit S n=1 Tax=Dorea longicatena TaxID=88431 RepID=UPI0003F671DF|nr:restriction endonuclease subunit S [Dorea longicatena]